MDEREVQILHGIWSKTDHHLRNREKPLNKGGENMLEKWVKSILWMMPVSYKKQKNPFSKSSVKGVDGIHLKIKISFGGDLTTSSKRG